MDAGRAGIPVAFLQTVLDGIKWGCTAGQIFEKCVEMGSLGDLPEAPGNLVDQIRSKVKVAAQRVRAQRILFEVSLISPEANISVFPLSGEDRHSAHVCR